MEQIPLSRVRPNPDQPRKLFEAGALAELAASIKANGLMQPITVRPVDDWFEIVAGERRWRAHCLLAEGGDWPTGTIAALVKPMSDEQRDIEAIVENLSRADITPMEEARAFKRLIDAGMTREELAKRLGIQQPWRITDRLRLFNLAPEFIAMMEAGQLALEAVYEISRLEKHSDQTKIIQAINRGQLTGYKAVRAAVAAILDGIAQADIFGEKQKPTEAEVETVKGMEQRVAKAADLLSAGFKEGEVVIARKVAPDKARLMADRLRVLRSQCLLMENQLREAAAQAAMAV